MPWGGDRWACCAVAEQASKLLLCRRGMFLPGLRRGERGCISSSRYHFILPAIPVLPPVAALEKKVLLDANAPSVLHMFCLRSLVWLFRCWRLLNIPGCTDCATPATTHARHGAALALLLAALWVCSFMLLSAFCSNGGVSASRRACLVLDVSSPSSCPRHIVGWRHSGVVAAGGLHISPGGCCEPDGKRKAKWTRVGVSCLIFQILFVVLFWT